jgi:uncharacterized protein
MELTHEFEVGVPIQEAWTVLTDLERIAPCMPGAQLTEVEGEEFRGNVKVKVGPITAQYKGVAKFIEKDQSGHRAVIDAQGRDTRGQGNANAVITATLAPQGTGTRVNVLTDLKLTGKVAQFGRGAIADVSGALLDQFVNCLEHDLLGVDAGPAGPGAEVVTAAAVGPAAEPASPAAPAAPDGVRKIDGPDAAAVDLLSVAGGTIAKYVLGAVVVVAVVVVLLVLLAS